MKIKKEFVDLIYSGKKQFEFRNSNDKAGIYKIKDKYFTLRKINNCCEYKIKKAKIIFEDGFFYQFCGYKITEQEYEWIKNNMDYFIDSETDETCIVVYDWKETPIKELEVVD